uniref:Uncharacterized protein n=1 Tax=Syphacia muris TaxID=451379 RepID=A0A0N5AV23_9BILA
MKQQGQTCEGKREHREGAEKRWPSGICCASLCVCVTRPQQQQQQQLLRQLAVRPLDMARKKPLFCSRIHV